MFRVVAVAATLALVLPSLALAQAVTPFVNGHGRAAPQKGPPAGGGTPVKPFVGRGAPAGAGVPLEHRRAFGPGAPGPGFARGPGGGPGNQFSFRGRVFPGVHAGAFAYPPGYGYRRWAAGAVLPPLFLAPAYYYGGWASLGLAPPPPGYQWVRYGPDLLLVNVPTGQVVDVAYGVFY